MKGELLDVMSIALDGLQDALGGDFGVASGSYEEAANRLSEITGEKGIHTPNAGSVAQLHKSVASSVQFIVDALRLLDLGDELAARKMLRGLTGFFYGAAMASAELSSAAIGRRLQLEDVRHTSGDTREEIFEQLELMMADTGAEFVIFEADGKFVQFGRVDDEFLVLDLPTSQMDEEEARRARKFFEAIPNAELDEATNAWQVVLPGDVGRAARICGEIFCNVFQMPEPELVITAA